MTFIEKLRLFSDSKIGVFIVAVLLLGLIILIDNILIYGIKGIFTFFSG